MTAKIVNAIANAAKMENVIVKNANAEKTVNAKTANAASNIARVFRDLVFDKKRHTGL